MIMTYFKRILSKSNLKWKTIGLLKIRI